MSWLVVMGGFWKYDDGFFLSVITNLFVNSLLSAAHVDQATFTRTLGGDLFERHDPFWLPGSTSFWSSLRCGGAHDIGGALPVGTRCGSPVES